MRRQQRLVKRVFDVVGAIAGLVLFVLPGAVISAVIKGTSRGPVLFIQSRVGRGGRLFKCAKFRTMEVGAERSGTITKAGDRRVTSVGRFLRRYKLDEFPQLWNVLTGRMSFVGPRPDMPGYADLLEGKARRLLEIRPGITGPASLLFRDEETLLASVARTRAFNDEVVYPAKVAINLDYLNHWSYWRDLVYLTATVAPQLTAKLGWDRLLGLNYEAFRAQMAWQSLPYRDSLPSEGGSLADTRG
jgi:lipopolysaccharide/colanic/teichoic acid biosynthesis glycosyltransferase